MNTRNFFAELKRRNVYKVAVAYAVVSWLLIQIATQVFPFFDIPNWAVRVVVLFLALGFPVALVLAWAFEITPEGIKRESEIAPDESITYHKGRKLIGITIAVAVAAGGMLAFQLLRPRLMTERIPAATQTAPVAVISEQSIAVLPFVDMSQAKDQGYFSDGISEELLNLLTKVPQLKVAARTSSFSFKGKGLEVPEIARQLGVVNVIEGSVRKSGDQVRITAQLIHAPDGFHLWSQTWDRKLDDIFKIQDEIAAEVVKELKVTILGEAPKARTTDPKAYALYLQAVQLARQNTAQAYEKSDALYRQALEIGPRYAPAWAGLAVNFINKVTSGLAPSAEGFARAREAAEKALEIDPDYAFAHSNLGRIAMFLNDLNGAARHHERALALDPTDLRVLNNAALFLANLGRTDEALALDEFQVRRDPVNVGSLINLGAAQSSAGRLDEAIASFRTALSLSPGLGLAHYYLGRTMQQKGDASGALVEIEQETIESVRMIGLPMCYHALGRKGDSDAALAALIAKYEKDAAYNIASVFAFRGDKDKAFEWLDKAVTYEDAGLYSIALDNDLFANVRSDARWLPFLRKIGMAPEQLAKIQFKVTLPPQ